MFININMRALAAAVGGMVGAAFGFVMYENGEKDGEKKGYFEGYENALHDMDDERNSKAFVDHVMGVSEDKDKPQDD